MNGSDTTAYRWIRFIAVRSVTAAAASSVLTCFQGSFSTRYALPAAQRARRAFVALRYWRASMCSSSSTRSRATSAPSFCSASPGSPPAGTVSPNRFAEKVSTRFTKLPRVSARSLFTVPAKCSQVNEESSDSGAFAMRKYRQ